MKISDHIVNIAKWFQQESHCPTGCGCKCIFDDGPTSTGTTSPTSLDSPDPPTLTPNEPTPTPHESNHNSMNIIHHTSNYNITNFIVTDSYPDKIRVAPEAIAGEKTDTKQATHHPTINTNTTAITPNLTVESSVIPSMTTSNTNTDNISTSPDSVEFLPDDIDVGDFPLNSDNNNIPHNTNNNPNLSTSTNTKSLTEAHGKISELPTDFFAFFS